MMFDVFIFEIYNNVYSAFRYQMQANNCLYDKRKKGRVIVRKIGK